MALAESKAPTFTSVIPGTNSPAETILRARAKALRAQASLTPQQTRLRALYTGGTFCYEAQWLLGNCLGDIYSNAPAGSSKSLENPFKSTGNTIVDLGDDVFTRGKPHPMIDPTPRNGRLIQEMADPTCGVLLLDVVLGYGSHEDPAGELAAAIAKGTVYDGIDRRPPAKGPGLRQPIPLSASPRSAVRIRIRNTSTNSVQSLKRRESFCVRAMLRPQPLPLVYLWHNPAPF